MVRILVSLFVLCVVGCSFLVDTSDRAQCSITADCQANPALAGRVCRAGFCELDPQPVSQDAGGCTTTAICTQQNSGKKSICRQAGSACVQLEIDGCEIAPTAPNTAGWEDANAIFVGTLLPLTLIQPNKTAPNNPYSRRQLRAIELGVKDLRDSLPTGYTVGAKQRPLAVIHCDTRGEQARAKAMFTHLTKVVGAQAVIVGWDEDLQAIAAEAKNEKTTIICSDCLTTAPPDTVTWRILPNITYDAALVRWRVAQIEAELEAKTPGAIKVAVLSEDLRVPRAFVDDLLANLEINGAKAVSQPTAFMTERASDPRSAFPDYDGIAQRIASFAPDVIVVALPSDFPRSYLPLIEQKWPAGKDKPHYVVTQLSYDATTFQGASDDQIARISGTHPFTTPELAANLATFETAYSNEWKEPGIGVHSAYEAFYVTALAVAAASGQAPFDSAAISNGFARLLSGAPFDIRKNDFNNALSMLIQGGTRNVRGIYTELDWNAQREVPSDMGMFCFERKAGQVVIKNVDNVRLSAGTGQVTVTGTYACP